MAELAITFHCAQCGRRAGSAALWPQGIPDGRIKNAPVLQTDGPCCDAVHLVKPENLERVATAIATGDVAALGAVDSEYAPAWCWHCNASYCSQHWTLDVWMDEGFYDCTYGLCPRDHRVKLDD